MFNVSDGGLYTNRQLGEIFKKINPQAQIKVEPGKRIYDLPAMDITACQEELGFIPEYSLEKGIRQVFNYFRQQEGLPLLS